LATPPACRSSAAESPATCSSPQSCSACPQSRPWSPAPTSRTEPQPLSQSNLANQSSLFRAQRGILPRCAFISRTLPLRPPPDEPRHQQRSRSQQNPDEVVREKIPGQGHNLRTEPERQQRLNQKAHEASRKNRQQKMREVHLERRRRQHHNLERRGRRQHRRKHQLPEFMVLERRVDFLEALRRKPLAQQHLATRIPDDVENDAAE